MPGRSLGSTRFAAELVWVNAVIQLDQRLGAIELLGFCGSVWVSIVSSESTEYRTRLHQNVLSMPLTLLEFTLTPLDYKKPTP